MIRKLLIANRGEIACRVMRTAKRMGIATVAVYSDADREGLHVCRADEAVNIGPAAPAESYLRIDRIVDAALQTGADAVHPGYGFLSENPNFAEALTTAGITFVGPPAAAIRAMGLKDAAKQLIEKAGVPVVPGYHGEVQDDAFLLQQARRIGFPLLIKARAGGGGRGMRRIETEAGFASALAGARSEAMASFGDAHVLIEKYVTAARHIEFQIFGDTHGNVIHLFERDCSLQRRHQKVMEEAPAAGMTDAVRKTMGEAAVEAARAVNYSGAGTVEFIADATEGLRADRFWFMEMNTRIQVEHPVTEAITGLDLVEWQLRVAAGEPLPRSQIDISCKGHAFEARIYAEDPARGFLPSPGRITHLQFPEKSVRVDSGVADGDSIPAQYDAMIAKLIVQAGDRPAALRQMTQALRDVRIAGVVTNVQFLAALCQHPVFIAGNHNTGFIESHLLELCSFPSPSDAAIIAAACVMAGVHLPTTELGAWCLWGERRQYVDLVVQGKAVTMCLARKQDGSWTAEHCGRQIAFTCLPESAAVCRLVIGNLSHTFHVAVAADTVTLFYGGEVHVFSRQDVGPSAAITHSGGALSAPMPALVARVFVKAGDPVEQGQSLLMLEAMKMEHPIIAPHDGVIDAVLAVQGEQVAEGALLIKMRSEAHD